MPEENISVFRQALEIVKSQFEEKFQDIMASVRADRENDKRTLQMVNENINNDRKAINQNRALNDKLETLLNVQNTMLSELRSMNNSIKDLSGGGGGMGLMGAVSAALAGAGIANFFSGNGDTNVDGGGGNDPLRNTGGGGNGTRNTGGGDNNIRNSNNETRLPNGVANKEIPLEAQAFLNVLTAEGYEGTERYPNSGYNTIVGRGGQFEGYERHPNRVGIVTSAGPSTAAGRYQIVKRTWDRLTRDYPEILTDFSPENQDLAAWILAQEDYERRTNGRNLLEDLKTEDPERLAYIERMLSGTWSSLKGGVHEGTAAGRFPELFRQNISDLREEREIIETPQQIEEGLVQQSIPLDVSRSGHLKNVLRTTEGGPTLLYNESTGERGGHTGHEYEYIDYSHGLQPVWEGELPSNITEGQNTTTLTDPMTGESFPSTFFVIQRTDENGNTFYTTTDFITNDTTGVRVRVSGRSASEISDQIGALPPTADQAAAIYEQADMQLSLTGSGRGLDAEGRRTAARSLLKGKYGSMTLTEAGKEELGLSVAAIREDLPVETVSTTPTSVFGTPLPENSVEEDESLTDGSGDDTLKPQDTPLEKDISGNEKVDQTRNRLLRGGVVDHLKPGVEHPKPGAGENKTLDKPTTSDQAPVKPQDTPLGKRIPEISEKTPTQQDETLTELPTLADQFMRFMSGESPTSMTGMTLDLAPAVETALTPDLPEPPTEENTGGTQRETTRETTSGGYTGGGGGSREQEQPQIEANAIGRFPWADKLIKYYNLSNMINTNMLS